MIYQQKFTKKYNKKQIQTPPQRFQILELLVTEYKIYEKVTARSFPKQMKDNNPFIQKTEYISSRINKKKSIPRSTVQTIKHQKKEILESEGKRQHLQRKNKLAMEAQRQNNIFKLVG